MMKTSLKKLDWLVKGFFVRYVLGLILTNEKRFCTNIAKLFGISHDSIYRYLSNNADLMTQFPSLMIKLAQYFHAQKKGWLIVDDTALSKIHAKYIEGIHWVYNSSLGRPEKGLCIVVIAWTDGDIIIPLAFDWWFSKKIAPDNHSTKIKIAQKLILKIVSENNFQKVLADAAYISMDMINFLQELKLLFVNRIHSNRKVTTKNGICKQLKEHPDFKFRRNERAKIIKVTINEIEVNVVVFKRKKKNSCDYEPVFLVTNIQASAEEIIKEYDIRWKIEPMFRTMKQSLGLLHCSSRTLKKQTLHINAVFFSFAFVQYEKNKKKLSCPQEAIRQLQDLKYIEAISSFNLFCRDFYLCA